VSSVFLHPISVPQLLTTRQCSAGRRKATISQRLVVRDDSIAKLKPWRTLETYCLVQQLHPTTMAESLSPGARTKSRLHVGPGTDGRARRTHTLSKCAWAVGRVRSAQEHRGAKAEEAVAVSTRGERISDSGCLCKPSSASKRRPLLTTLQEVEGRREQTSSSKGKRELAPRRPRPNLLSRKALANAIAEAWVIGPRSEPSKQKRGYVDADQLERGD
jgi:hypothetical protein